MEQGRDLDQVLRGQELLDQLDELEQQVFPLALELLRQLVEGPLGRLEDQSLQAKLLRQLF